MAVEVKIPSAGESITQVQVAEWRKKEGDLVRQDEIVAEIETDKASMELPAPATGRLGKITKKAGETAAVGEVIAVIDESAAAGSAPRPAEPTSAAAPTPNGAKRTAAPVQHGVSSGEPPRIMPAAARLIEEHGLDPAAIQASGPGGRVLKEDVLRHLAQAESRRPDELAAGGPSVATAPAEVAHVARQAAPAREVAPSPGPGRPVVEGDRAEQVVPMTMLRRRIAERLVQSQQTAALLTTFNEIDMSGVMSLRREHAEAFQARYAIKLGFMSFFVKAAIDALKQIPQLNAEIRGTDIVYRNYYDIGVAVGTDKGLVVPVLRNAERMSFAEVETTIADMARRARDRKLTVEEMQGGTFTISNGGIYGSLLSTPIINPPQSGILGLHATQDRPVARDGQVVIRPMMYVALTYDHRIVDGKEAVTFLKRIKECIEQPSRMLLEI